jgi:hypothetical protein
VGPALEAQLTFTEATAYLREAQRMVLTGEQGRGVELDMLFSSHPALPLFAPFLTLPEIGKLGILNRAWRVTMASCGSLLRREVVAETLSRRPLERGLSEPQELPEGALSIPAIALLRGQRRCRCGTVLGVPLDQPRGRMFAFYSVARHPSLCVACGALEGFFLCICEHIETKTLDVVRRLGPAITIEKARNATAVNYRDQHMTGSQLVAAVSPQGTTLRQFIERNCPALLVTGLHIQRRT